MRVIRARVLGFCPGVRRAVDIAMKEAQSGQKTLVFGQIVHNPQVSAQLAELGVLELNETDNASLEHTNVIIRSHGGSPHLIKGLKARGANIIDATCPKVAANQRSAREHAQKGYTVVIAGDRGHGETLGIAGHARGSIIVSSVDEARELGKTLKPGEKIALIAQTTMSLPEYDAILVELQKASPGIVDCKGICGATMERQKALSELCKIVDAMVIVGGKNSANTRRLAQKAESEGKRAFLVESADELPEEIKEYKTVGLSAGASTPDYVIDEVEKMLIKA